MTIQQLLLASAGEKVFDVTIASNQTDYNLLTVLTAAPYNYNNTEKATINLTINSAVQVTASSTGTPALTTGAITSNATLNIINNGSVKGKGGAGGAGGSADYDLNIANPGAAGSAGGTALNIASTLSGKVTITNGSGELFGGGGGGGGGGGRRFIGGSGKDQYTGAVGGSGGGGGAVTGAGGSGGVGSGSQSSVTGNVGSAGTTSAGGAGGAAADTGNGAAGGNGGGFGAAGSAGQTPLATGGAGGAGGAAGKAIELNGGSAPTFISGNDSTHVKGAVS